MTDVTMIKEEIRERLREVDGLIEELRLEAGQLEKVLAAVAVAPVAAARVAPPRRRRAPRGGHRAVTAKPEAGRRRTGGRAEQTLARIAAEPGITAAELASAMGIKRNYLYRVLPALEKDGKIHKDGKGYHPAGRRTS